MFAGCPFEKNSVCSKRQPLIYELWMALSDIFSHMNHGMTFVPLIASFIFMLAVFNYFRPDITKSIMKWPDGLMRVLKFIFYVTIPILAFQFFWRPYNYFLFFWAHHLMGSSILVYCLPVVSLLSALGFLAASVQWTKRRAKDLEVSGHVNRQSSDPSNKKHVNARPKDNNTARFIQQQKDNSAGRSLHQPRDDSAGRSLHQPKNSTAWRSLLAKVTDRVSLYLNKVKFLCGVILESNRLSRSRERNATSNSHHRQDTRSPSTSRSRSGGRNNKNLCFKEQGQPTYRCTRSGLVYHASKYRGAY